MIFTMIHELFEHAFSTSLEMKVRFDIGLQFLFIRSRPSFLSRGLTMAIFHSSENSPVVRHRLTIFVMMGRQATSNCLRVLVGMMSNLQCLLFMFIITVHTSISVSGQKYTNMGISCCMGLYGMLMKFSLIFSILDRKNSAKSSASSSSVLLGGIGFCIVLPVSLLTRWKSPLVSFLQSRTFLLIDCFLK